ncbi:MAG: cytochrome o ubiquinol oxidase subunit 3 [Francisellaceae bacterium]|jgi:cytochrome o ubiquinol oxidase subunit 3
MSIKSSQHQNSDIDSKVIYGVWVYILTNCIIFSCLFASFVVLRDNVYGSISINEVASLPFVLLLTFLIIIMNLSNGLGYVQANLAKKSQVMLWLAIAFIAALAYIILLLCSLNALTDAGYSWRTSGFLSIYFILIEFFAFNVVVALAWSLILFIQLSDVGLTCQMKTRLTCLNLYGNYLSLIWLFIFIFVFLMRVI